MLFHCGSTNVLTAQSNWIELVNHPDNADIRKNGAERGTGNRCPG